MFFLFLTPIPSHPIYLSSIPTPSLVPIPPHPTQLSLIPPHPVPPNPSDPLDIDDGLYNFLSPQLIPHMEGGAGHGLGPQGSELLRPLQGQILTDKPEWFQKGSSNSVCLHPVAFFLITSQFLMHHSNRASLISSYLIILCRIFSSG